MAYTPFAIMAALLLITMVTNANESVNQPQTHDHELMKNIEYSVEETSKKYSQNSLKHLENVNEFSLAVGNMTLNGSHNGFNQNVSLKQYNEELEHSKNPFELKTDIKSVTASSLTVRILSQTVVDAGSVKRGLNTSTSYQVRGINDPLLSTISYDTEIRECSFNRLGKKLGTGVEINGKFRGEPSVNPNTTNPTNQKVLLTDNLGDYSQTVVSNYLGYVTTDNPSDRSDYNSNYVTGVSNIPAFVNHQNVVVSEPEGYWKTNLERTVQNNCYLSTSSQSVPGIEDRFENKTRGTSNDGIYTVLNSSRISQDSSESNIGFERVYKPSDLVEIKGISKGEGKINSNFRINRSTAVNSGLGGLVN